MTGSKKQRGRPNKLMNKFMCNYISRSVRILGRLRSDCIIYHAQNNAGTIGQGLQALYRHETWPRFCRADLLMGVVSFTLGHHLRLGIVEGQRSMAT